MSLPASVSPSAIGGESSPSTNELEQQLFAELRWSESNLQALSKGVRLIANQMIKQNQANLDSQQKTNKDSADNTSHATADETISSGDGACLSDILATDRLAPMPAADLLALHNAVEMVREHSRLSSLEAAQAVEDTIQSQAAARYWQKRAQASEAELRTVGSEAARLKQQNQKLMAERKVLVKECRKLRKELADKNQETMWSQLESYVSSALNIHEHQLKTPRATSSTPQLTPANTIDSLDEEEDASSLASAPSQLSNNNNKPKVDTTTTTSRVPPQKTSSTRSLRTPRLPMAMSFPFGSNKRRKSQEKLAAAAAAAAEGTFSDHATPRNSNISTASTSSINDHANKTPPQSPGRRKVSEDDDDESSLKDKVVSIERNESFGSAKLVSPITFLETPPGIQPARYGEETGICDPQVLRSLALPSVAPR